MSCETAGEDSVKCLFFSISELSCSPDYWPNLCESLNSKISSFSKGFLWHKDKFKLYLPIPNANEDYDELPPHLMSLTCFGDNIEDEWFIVFLVYEITKLYKDLIVQITDIDGNFLLIEAADYLPSWTKPETTVNRIFVHNSKLHLIPPEIIGINNELKLRDSIKIIKTFSKKTLATSEIQEAVLQRIQGYPEKIVENNHKAVVNIPLDIAALLHVKPSLISELVNTYCNHDVLDAKSCKNVVFQDCISVKVTFTKFMYAMLLHSKLIPVRNMSIIEKDKRNNLGFKLTCGYHILMCKASADLLSSSKYNKFLDNLKKSNYFRDNIEGSKEYFNLLEIAQDYFVNIDSGRESYVTNEIQQIINSNEYIESKQALKSKSNTDLEDDNEDWLNVLPNQLDILLQTRYNHKCKSKNTETNVSYTTSKLSEFLKDTSSFEGIELRQSPEGTESDNIEFNSEEFIESLQKMLNLISPTSNKDYDDSEDTSEEEIDNNDEDLNKKEVFENILQSIKEEGPSGPSSNILRNIGINKSDILDSDDD